MAMDNRSTATWDKQIMNEFCYNCLPSKGAGQEECINTKYTDKKRGRSGEGGENQNQLLTSSKNRNEWQAHGLPFHVTCEKAGRGVDIMAFAASPRHTLLDYPLNFGQREKT